MPYKDKEHNYACRKAWELAHPEAKKKINREYAARRRKREPLLMWARGSIYGHRGSGYVVNISEHSLLEFIKDKNKCLLCGVDMVYSGTGFNDNTATVDRINNMREISLDNIQIICAKCNRTKSNRSMKEFVDYCRRITDKFYYY